MLLIPKIFTPWGYLRIRYDPDNYNTVQVHWAKKRWWQLRYPPVEEARIVLWVVDYLLATRGAPKRNQR